MSRLTARKLREKASGTVFWVNHRIGFAGHEYDAGGGWRKTVPAAVEAARKSGTLREATS